jgi:ribonuclease P protein subunit POP4
MKPQEVIRHELIGLEVEVHDAGNKSLIGIKGKVVDETKNMLEIQTKHGTKSIIKDQAILDFIIEGKKVRVDGKILTKRPEERTKKV